MELAVLVAFCFCTQTDSAELKLVVGDKYSKIYETSLNGDVLCECSVIRRFLQQHDQHRERLYEVEAPGGWAQRRNIWLNIHLGRYSSKQQVRSCFM